MSENTGSSRRRKAFSATLAIAMVAVMLLSGTLALYFHAEVTNHFSDGAKEVVAHDDFIEGMNKDVYVENTGETEVYVRVKLTETLKLDGETVVDHVIHKPNAKVGSTNANPAVGEEAGDTTAAKDTHSYFTWVMGRNEADTGLWFLSAKDEKYKKSGKYTLIDGVAQDTSGRTWTAADVDANEINWSRNCEVLTMADYQAKVGKDFLPTQFIGWIFDEDGWAYWSQKLEPNRATGLLLDNVIVNKAKLGNQSYDYDIKVDVEAVDDEDFDIWLNGGGEYQGMTITTTAASTKAQEILAIGSRTITEAEINAKITEVRNLDENGSKGAMMLYESAKKVLQSDYPEFARKLFTQGNFAQKAYTKNKEEYDKTILALNTEGNAIDLTQTTCGITDIALAKSFVYTYGDSDAKTLTGDQALAIYGIDASYIKNQGWGEVGNLDGLTAKDFPNLIDLIFDDAAIEVSDINGLESRETMVTSSMVDRPLREQIERITILRNQAGSGELDLSGFTSLLNFHADRTTNLTNVTNLPTGIQFFAATASSTKIDDSTTFDAARFPDLRLLTMPSSMNTLEGLNSCLKLKEVAIRNTAISGNLDVHKLNELCILYFDGCTAITSVELPKQAIFSGEIFNVNCYWRTSPAFNIAGSGLTSIDIRGNATWETTGLSLARLTNLQLAIRDKDQGDFTNWDTTTDRYECVVNADGTTAVLWKHPMGGGTATAVAPADVASIAGLQALIPTELTIVAAS